MLGRDHALTGAAAFGLLAPGLHVTGLHLAAATVLAGGAALLPDIDHPDSTVARTFGLATRLFAWMTEKLSGGHRHGTHSLPGAALFTVAAWTASWWRGLDGHWTVTGFPAGHWTGPAISAAHLIPETMILALLYSAGLRALRVGGHHGDLAGLLLAAGTVLTGQDTGTVTPWHIPVTAAVMALGCACHIAGDALTHGGCPLLWPASSREFHLLPAPVRFTTGRLAEHAVVSPLLTMLLLLALTRAAGTAGHPAPH